MIPKILHYCWFGGQEMDKLSTRCLETWKIYCSDYLIKRWDETSFDIDTSPQFVRDAYQKKKWAFVSDYVRAYALYTEGGIYLDSDVELKKNLDEFLHHGAFSGFEKKGYPFTALWGAEKNHVWPKKVLEYYKTKDFEEVPNTAFVSNLLVTEFGVDPQADKLQHLKNDITIYPSNYFCIDLPVNYACHHFNGSWITDIKGEKILPFRLLVLYNFYKQNAIDISGEKEVVKSISWIVLLSEIFKRPLRPLIRKLK